MRVVEVRERHMMGGVDFVVEWYDDGPTSTTPHSFRTFTASVAGAAPRAANEELARVSAEAEAFAAKLREEGR